MTSSGPALDSGVASHPAEITAEVAARLREFAESADEHRAIEDIVRLTVPPPDLRLLRQLIGPLRTLRRLKDSAFEAAVGYFERNRNNDALNGRWHEKAYPFPPTLLRLFNVSGDGAVCHVTFALTLVELGQSWPDPRHFSGHMYYKHLVAYRDVCSAFWQSRRANHPSAGSLAPLLEPVASVARSPSSQSDLTLLREFAKQGARSPLRSKCGRLKYEYTAALLDGDLTFGDARPRGALSRGSNQLLGMPIRIESSTREALTTSDLIQSAMVSPVYLDDDGPSCSIEFPSGATTKDRQRIVQRAASGFARSNVKTAADMAILSRVTYQDYLAFAVEHLDAPERALAWLSAFPGVDVTRPLALKKSAKHAARNDQILLDPTERRIEYNVLRRSDRLDPAQYETAGRMQLPMPPGVAEGLLEIIRKGHQEQPIASADRVAERFSRSHPGLTPTLNRLRASSRFFLAPLEFSELAFCAVSGRVTPALKGISAYYPHLCRDIVSHFCKAYGSLTRALGLEGWGSVEALVPSNRDQLFCGPSPGVESIRVLLARVADIYEARCAEIRRLGVLSKPDNLVHALQAHETACYIVQQLVVGVRPIGKLATVVVDRALLIAMVRDKSSMFASERSYSPVTMTHRRLIDTSAKNRSALQQSLRWSGRELAFDEEVFSLAVELRCAGSREPVFGSRLTNDYFHNRSCVAAEVQELARQPNWIRHVATAHLAGCAPQWMLDELFGHTRIGRQPFGRWSTAGGSHFRFLRDRLEELLAPIVDCRLFRSLPVSSDRG